VQGGFVSRHIENTTGAMTSFDPGATVPPVHTPAELIAIEHKHGAHNYNPLPIVIARARGSWVQDTAGHRYLDMLSSYSALNQGHRHPRIMAALKAQADRVTLTSRAFHNDQLGPFVAKLSAISGFEMVLPMNTGAEAIETGLKAARKWAYTTKGVPAGQAEIITASGNFHGRTTTIVGFSSEDQYQDGFGPFTPGFVTVPFGDAAALEAAITPNTAAFLVEPIQAEGGILMPPADYLKRVREICTRHNVLLFLDEIQTGLGRTGRMFAFERAGIRPDCVSLGKALGGGVYPVSAFLADAEVMSVFGPGDHGSTFGGNPLGAAIAMASLDVVIDEGLAERAEALGTRLMEQLRDLDSPHVVEVRGAGLLIGIEIKPESGPARVFCEALMAAGVLCKETHTQVIRLAPPLNIDQDDLDWGLARLAEVLA
jgi:ornithine--oxo-acid transaminase